MKRRAVLLSIGVGIVAFAAFVGSPSSENVLVGRRLRFLARQVKYLGDNYQCNTCGRSMRRFQQLNQTEWQRNNRELQCPFCGSRPRHRTAYIYFHERTNLFDGKPKRMLHVAPEPSLAPKFQAARYIDYLSADLDPAMAMVKMDITDIQYPDNSFDVIYCSHVLEHVPEDRKAMRELARVLKPGGWAILAAPIIRPDKTFENPKITSAADREREYGRWDHVRAYGPDFVDRLHESGFDVTVDRFASGFSDEMVRRHGLSREDMYVCRKRQIAQ